MGKRKVEMAGLADGHNIDDATSSPEKARVEGIVA